MIKRLMSGLNKNTIWNCLRSRRMRIWISWYLRLFHMRKEERISFPLLIGSLIIHSDVCTREECSAMPKVICSKNATKNTHSPNLIKEEQNQAQVEICMRSSQPVNQQMDREEIPHSGSIQTNKSLFKPTNSAQITPELLKTNVKLTFPN